MKNFIFYKGPSILDGRPILAIATLNSNNRKTGNIVQTWILRADISPIEASKSGGDVSVCGNCPLRQGVGGACYVNLGQAPTAIYKASEKGRYPTLVAEEASNALKGRIVRLGSYGDPAAIPAGVWENLLSKARASLGYTHQLKHKNFDPKILNWCMISTETAKQTEAIHAQGYKTFRVITEKAQLLNNEIVCPSEKGITCVECKRCNGAAHEGKSIAIQVHGSRTRKHTNKYQNANIIAASV